MNLNEAITELEEHGYVVNEGKIGRALVAGAIALGSLFGLSNAKVPKNINDLQTDSTYTEIELSEVPSNLKNHDFYTANKIYYDTEDDYYYAVNGNKIIATGGEVDHPENPTEINFDKNGVRKSMSTIFHNKKYDFDYLSKVIFDKDGKAEKIIEYYDKDGEDLREIRNYKTKTGVEYYDTGEIKAEFKLDNNNNIHGILKMYYQNGKFAGSEKYIHGEYVESSTKCVDGRRGGYALNCQIPMEN